MALCWVGHSLLVGVGVASLAPAAGSIAVLAAIALVGLGAMTVRSSCVAEALSGNFALKAL
jgi:hypothetical protein